MTHFAPQHRRATLDPQGGAVFAVVKTERQGWDGVENFAPKRYAWSWARLVRFSAADAGREAEEILDQGGGSRLAAPGA